MHTHAQLELRMLFHSTADLEGAFHGRFRSIVKNQRHAVASWNGNEACVCLRRAELFRRAHHLIE